MKFLLHRTASMHLIHKHTMLSCMALSLILMATLLGWLCNKHLSKKGWFESLLWAYQLRFADAELGFDRKLRFIFRTLVYFSSSRQWFEYLHGSSLKNFVAGKPDFLDICHRPFYDLRLSSRQRVWLLIQHYTFICAYFEEPIVYRVMTADSELVLAKLVGKSGGEYVIRLAHKGQFDKEGCISLQFVQADAVLLTLTFSIISAEAISILKIGGIQGGINSRDVLRAATHDLHNLQPRLLLIRAARELAQAFNIEKIEGVHQNNHIYQSTRYKRKKEVNIDYDELWLAAGGALTC